MNIQPDLCCEPEFLSEIIQSFRREDNRSQRKAMEAKLPVYYFSCGSTMHPTLFEEKIGKAEFVGKAALKGLQLHFFRIYRNGPVTANLVEEPHSIVEGAVYKITRRQLKQLDKWKGYPEISNRMTISFQKDLFSDPIPVEVHVLKVQPTKEYYPDPYYAQFMLAGAEKIGVSREYYQRLYNHVNKFPKSKL
jgi:gamma-glutamylcyclotransferase (GGCT)/AIG2-like uncharacterized protein YtfP